MISKRVSTGSSDLDRARGRAIPRGQDPQRSDDIDAGAHRNAAAASGGQDAVDEHRIKARRATPDGTDTPQQHR